VYFWNIPPNQHKFSNGNCGYILKPWYLRDPHARAFDPFTENLIDQVTAASYKVQIISGQWLGTTNGVYVEVEIYGLPGDTIRKEFKTKQVKGPNPMWGIDSEVFTFRKVIAPQMALLRLAVFEENSNKVS
jgi:phosphatidylinositol phospholipase C beta